MEIKIISPSLNPIKVEKEKTPIPVRKVLYSIFPFHEMEIGQSFFVEKGRFKKKAFYELRTLIYQKSREYIVETGHISRFTTRIDREKQGVRCWRIE